MTKTTKIFCACCDKQVKAELVYGSTVYPHRKNLHKLPFWRCPLCLNYVGCHHKTNNPTKPLGCIVGPKVKALRLKIHRELDPIWKSGIMTRRQVYKYMSGAVREEFHTASCVKTVEDGEFVLIIIDGLKRRIRADGFKI